MTVVTDDGYKAVASAFLWEVMRWMIESSDPDRLKIAVEVLDSGDIDLMDAMGKTLRRDVMDKQGLDPIAIERILEVVPRSTLKKLIQEVCDVYRNGE